MKISLSNQSLVSNNHYTIVGAGPVGMYLSLKLLLAGNYVTIYAEENSQQPRIQVVRIPPSVAKQLPDSIRKELWPHSNIRKKLFDTVLPSPVGYDRWFLIQVGDFQSILLAYMRRHYSRHLPDETQTWRPHQFYYLEQSIPLKNLPMLSGAPLTSFYNSRMIFFASGGKTSRLIRTKLKVKDHHYYKKIGDGLYLNFQQTEKETYRRGKHLLSSTFFKHHGFTYTSSNNRFNRTQVYTYPNGILSKIFNHIPDEIRYKGIYHLDHKKNILHLGDNMPVGLSASTQYWLGMYKQYVLSFIYKMKISLPDDLKRIQLFYAPRSLNFFDKAWHHATFVTNLTSADRTLFKRPVVYIGDALGSTDYRLGLSLGRGLLMSDYLTNIINERNVLDKLQTYWDEIIDKEFKKEPSTLENSSTYGKYYKF